jgi:hypothetical protein
MNPRLRILLALYTASVGAGAAIADEPVPALFMAFALGYQTKAVMPKRTSPRPSVIPQIEI